MTAPAAGDKRLATTCSLQARRGNGVFLTVLLPTRLGRARWPSSACCRLGSFTPPLHPGTEHLSGRVGHSLDSVSHAGMLRLSSRPEVVEPTQKSTGDERVLPSRLRSGHVLSARNPETPPTGARGVRSCSRGTASTRPPSWGVHGPRPGPVRGAAPTRAAASVRTRPAHALVLPPSSLDGRAPLRPTAVRCQDQAEPVFGASDDRGAWRWRRRSSDAFFLVIDRGGSLAEQWIFGRTFRLAMRLSNGRVRRQETPAIRRTGARIAQQGRKPDAIGWARAPQRGGPAFQGAGVRNGAESGAASGSRRLFFPRLLEVRFLPGLLIEGCWSNRRTPLSHGGGRGAIPRRSTQTWADGLTG